MKGIVLLTFFLASFFSSGTARAQSKDWAKHWTHSPIPLNADLVPPYFLNENLGFAFKGYAHYRTTDGGLHWTSIRIIDSLTPFSMLRVNDIYFANANHGYLIGVDGFDGGIPGIYETVDSGSHWKSILVSSTWHLSALYFSDNSLYVESLATLTGGTQVLKTSDDGNHWDTVLTTPYAANRSLLFAGDQDSIIYIENKDSSGNTILYYSTNDGINWSSNVIDSAGTTGCLYPFPHSSDILRTIVSKSKADNMAIEHSSDFGKTWEVYNPAIPVSSYIGGVRLGGEGCALYLCDAEDFANPPGIFRSMDRGKTWTLVPGLNFDELDDDDHLTLCVTDCGAVVFVLAVDTAISPGDGLWRTTDGGDGSMSACSSNSSIRFSSSRIINDSFNIQIHLPIYFHHSAPMNDVDMILHYPTISLNLTSTTLYNGKSFDASGSQWPGRAQLHFAAADLNGAPDSLLGYANFLWTPFEFACDDITFDSIDTHSSEAPCSASGEARPFTGIIGSFKTCGLADVNQNETGSTSLDFSISPNPAQSSIQINATNNPGKLRFELFNALGTLQRTGLTSEDQFKIDITGLAEGNYYLRIQNGNKIITKRLVIVK